MPKKAVLYGLRDCGWTQKQRGVVKRSPSLRKHSRYVECSRSKKCKNVHAFPTWEVDGTVHPGFRTARELRRLLSKSRRSRRRSR